MVKPTRDADQLVEVLQRVSEETGEPWWGPGEPPPKAEVQPFLWSVLRDLACRVRSLEQEVRELKSRNPRPVDLT